MSPVYAVDAGAAVTRVLALDCAAGACSVAVRDGDRLLAAERIAMDRGHAEALIPMLARVMSKAGTAFDQLDAVAATVGPGSFTGLRIGLAAARGVALAAGLPTVPVTTLEAVAEAVGPAAEPLLVVLDAKRHELYGQWFGPTGATLDAPCAAPVEALMAARPTGAGRRVRVAGDAAALVLGLPVDPSLAILPAGDSGPDAQAVAAVAIRRLAGGGAGRLTPLYLRAPDVTPPR